MDASLKTLLIRRLTDYASTTYSERLERALQSNGAGYAVATYGEDVIGEQAHNDVAEELRQILTGIPDWTVELMFEYITDNALRPVNVSSTSAMSRVSAVAKHNAWIELRRSVFSWVRTAEDFLKSS